MTVLLVVLTFVAFLAIDAFYSRKKVVIAQPQVQPAAARMLASFVRGFEVPQNLRYHPGHTWALNEGPALVRVGIDDFAAKLLGKVERITLPQRGQWVRQGQKIATMFRDGKSVDMVSPIEGTVADVNDTALANPEAARQDCYGEGWLLKVQAPDAKTNLRNLLGGGMIRAWMEEAVARLQQRSPVMLGALAQDGGPAVDDITAHMPDQDWSELTREFFLS